MAGKNGKRRVVVTGMGIVSCLGNDMATVSEALQRTRPGIRFMPQYAELGLRTCASSRPASAMASRIDT